MKYQAVVHRRFEDHGAVYVYVSNSASILRLDETSDEILRAFSPGGEDAESWLLAQGPDRDELQETFTNMVALGIIRPEGEVRPPSTELPPAPFPLATLVLNVTNKCNLSCTYCYEFGEDKLTNGSNGNGASGSGTGGSGASGSGARPLSAMMSPETARQSVDFLFRSVGERKQVQLTFFGGETLLNFGTIRATVEYAEQRAREDEKVLGLALTTNATLLTDEVIEFLVEHRFGVNISIDGDQKDQDRHRQFKSGKGSFETIVPRIRALIARNKEKRGRPLGARVTLTRGSSRILEIYRFLVDELGFDEVGFAPVTSAAERDYAMAAADLQNMLSEFGELADEFVAQAARGRHHGFSNLNDLLRELHQGINKAHPCGAGLGLLGVSTEGKLGLCHRFVESRSHELGDVRTGVDEETRAGFLRKGHVDTKIPCQECFARPLCAGGCYHEAHVRYGDMGMPNLHYCDWIRSWTDLGLSAYARIMTDNPSFFQRFETV